MAYGIDTVETLAQVINRDLKPVAIEVTPVPAPQGSWGTPDEQVPAEPARS